MLLYTPGGCLFPGFDNVVFAKQSAEKLASVGDLCDAGMVCIFDSEGLKTYKKDDCVITGNVFTKDKRDAKTSLYPLTLYRKVAEKSINVPTFSSLAIEQKKAQNTSSEKVSPEKLPAFIQDGECLPTALLARTYIKQGLSEVDRYHAKCGDIGIKHLKRAFPSLKVPAQYTCEFCIEGKIHNCGHGPCAPGRRQEYHLEYASIRTTAAPMPNLPAAQDTLNYLSIADPITSGRIECQKRHDTMRQPRKCFLTLRLSLEGRCYFFNPVSA